MDIFSIEKEFCDKAFLNSPFLPFVSVNSNADKSVSVIFKGQKLIGLQEKKQTICIVLKTDFYNAIDLTGLDIDAQTVKSMPEFVRFFVGENQFVEVMDVIHKDVENYVDVNFVPEYTFDCCDRYMQCSDARRCTNPDRIHAKSCTYRQKLENGIVFFGDNRNV